LIWWALVPLIAMQMTWFHSPLWWSKTPLCMFYHVAGIWNWDSAHWSSLAGSNILLCWHRPSGLASNGWSLRTKRSLLMFTCKQVTEAESKAQPTYGCIWLHWLVHLLNVIWPSCFNF
jgi:hypothetical protein